MLNLTRTMVLAVVAMAGLWAAPIQPRAAEASEAAVLNDLHRSNQESMELGRLAQLKGYSQEARRLGDVVFYDHRASERRVSRLAKTLAVDLVKVPPAQRPLAAGKAFDAAFAEVLVADHGKDVAAVEEALNSTTDPRLQKLLNGQLSMLRKHLDAAQKVLATTAQASR
jgi:putative membrane protein